MTDVIHLCWSLTDTGVFMKFKNLDYRFDFLKKSVAFFEFFD